MFNQFFDNLLNCLLDDFLDYLFNDLLDYLLDGLLNDFLYYMLYYLLNSLLDDLRLDETLTLCSTTGTLITFLMTIFFL